MGLSVEQLLEPVSDDAPSGEDLSYDNDRYALEQIFESVEASGLAEDGAPPEVDWRRVVGQIEAQFARSKDVWLAVYLARAGARQGSLETVADGAAALAGLMEAFWDTMHPTLDELGLPGRKAPCDSLASRSAFLAPLERVVLVEHPRLGRYSGADLERFRSEGVEADDYGLFRAALDDLPDEALQEAETLLSRIERDLRRADAVFTEHAAGEPSPNFGPTYATLTTLQLAVRAFMPEASPEAEEPGPGTAEASGNSDAAAQAPSAGKPGGSGRVDSREDVVKALNAAIDYYRRKEPSSPIPMLLERAKAWVPMSFLDIMSDLAPEGVDQAVLVLKSRPVEDDDD